jgi:hypothetical protein
MPSSQKPPRTTPEKSPAIPETNQPIRNATDLKLFVRKTLLASPAFPGFCADYLEPHGANRQQVMDLAEKYQKNYRGSMSSNMSIPSPKSCTHIKVDGVRCGSPALRGEQFCYFHQRMLRGVRNPPNARLHPIALIESPEAIQASLMEVINALARNQIDVKRAELMLRALHIAVRNARNVHFGLHAARMVNQVPEYPDAHAVPAALARGQAQDARADRTNADRANADRTNNDRTNNDRSNSNNDRSKSSAQSNDSSLNLPTTAAQPFEPPASGSSFREAWKRDGEEIKRLAAEIRAARERESWRGNHPGVDPLSPKPPLGVKDAATAKPATAKPATTKPRPNGAAAG